MDTIFKLTYSYLLYYPAQYEYNETSFHYEADFPIQASVAGPAISANLFPKLIACVGNWSYWTGVQLECINPEDPDGNYWGEAFDLIQGEDNLYAWKLPSPCCAIITRCGADKTRRDNFGRVFINPISTNKLMGAFGRDTEYIDNNNAFLVALKGAMLDQIPVDSKIMTPVLYHRGAGTCSRIVETKIKQLIGICRDKRGDVHWGDYPT